MSDEEAPAREQRVLERERRNALWEKPFAEWTDDELFGELTLSYRAPEIPLCRVCGDELSCQSVGGGEPTVYACSGLVDGVLQEGRRIADEHYRSSEWKDYRQGGDGRVLELIRRLRDARGGPPVGVMTAERLEEIRKAERLGYLDEEIYELLDVAEWAVALFGETDAEMLTRLRAEARKSEDDRLGWEFDRILSAEERRVFEAWVRGPAHSVHTPPEGAA